ncbi:MAG: hypothetical protein ABJF10_16590 [Chthoniobacter sp.]|uniref:hypothetical protein n=1 Tax=Chthoniobacter sp. TaxID=2510640 RepID=UPI0032A8C255
MNLARLYFSVCWLLTGAFAWSQADQIARPVARGVGGTSAPNYPRYAVVDLGAGMTPIRVANNGWVLVVDGNANYYRWKAGTLELLTSNDPNAAVGASDMNNAGVVVGGVFKDDNSVNAEPSAGMRWDVNSSVGTKVSSPVAGPSPFPGGSTLKQMQFTAINDQGDAYSNVYTGYRFCDRAQSSESPFSNAYKWPGPTGSSSTALSSCANADSDNNPDLPPILGNWINPWFSISRANKDGRYIGQRGDPGTPQQSNNYWRFTPETVSNMVDGQVVDFYPVDVSEAGTVVGIKPGSMIVWTGAGSETGIGTGVPVAINNATRLTVDANGNTTPVLSEQILGYLQEVPTLWELTTDRSHYAPQALTDLIPSGTGWTFTSVVDLNDQGVIVGYGTFQDPSVAGSAPEAHGFLLLPVEITKLWSDQLSGVTDANYLPNQTGGQERQYLLMGACQSSNFDLKGHLKAKVDVGGSSELRNKILWRLATKIGNRYLPEDGSSTYDANGEIVTVVLDTVFPDDENSYNLVAGYDQDGNGQLSSAEATIRPSYKWNHHDSNGQPKTDAHEYEVKIVSRDTYNANNTGTFGLSNLSDYIWAPGGLTEASRCMNAFLTAGTPVGATGPATTVTRSDFRLTHAVGLIFPPPGNPGPTINATFSRTSQMADDAANAHAIYVLLADRISAKKDEVHQRFGDPGNVVETFDWHFEGGSVNFANASDPDLFLALGDTIISPFDVTVKVHRDGYTIESVTITGTITDLYDFDYDGPPKWPEFVRKAARVQSGYNTLGNAGRIYTVEIQMLNNACRQMEGTTILQ